MMNLLEVDSRRGWYVSRIQDALQELSFDTFFSEITRDFDFPENLILELPKDFFNIRQLYVYNGGCCSPETSNVVHWKRTYINKSGGSGYTARVKDSGETTHLDPFIDSGYWNSFYESGYYGGKLYANVQNGNLMFSSDCASYKKVRIVYNSMGGEIGDIPIIPRFFERAINDYVEYRFYNSMKARAPRTYRALARDSYDKLYDIRIGSWRKAKMRITSMDSWEKESLNEYISGIIHK